MNLYKKSFMSIGPNNDHIQWICMKNMFNKYLWYGKNYVNIYNGHRNTSFVMIWFIYSSLTPKFDSTVNITDIHNKKKPCQMLFNLTPVSQHIKDWN